MKLYELYESLKGNTYFKLKTIFLSLLNIFVFIAYFSNKV